jgi:hypothetical protein
MYYFIIHTFNMAEIDDVYGTNYQSECRELRNNHIIHFISNNIAHRNFNFNLFDCEHLWDSSGNLNMSIIDELIKKICIVNPKMHMFHINRHSNEINMLPELVINVPVEYFWIIDEEYSRIYFIYITTREVGAY